MRSASEPDSLYLTAGTPIRHGSAWFLDLSSRYQSLDAKPDPLVALNKLIPWEEFRPKLLAALEEAGLRAKAETRKSAAGRKPLDEIVMFKVLVLQSLYNLSDDNAEYLIRDRLSFMRFLGLGLEGTVPDAKSIWLYREAWAKDGTAKVLFEAFDAYLKQQGYLAMGGQIVDATIVPVPKNRNTPEENAAIKAGEVPSGWAENPAKLRQKDLDARWTKKHGQSHYGYKNHINIDRTHKLVREYTVSPLGSGIRATEQVVLPSQNWDAHGAFFGIVGHLEAAIAEITYQRLPPRQCVADRLGQLALAADLGQRGVEERLQFVQPWCCMLSPRGAAVVRRASIDAALDGEQRGDPLQGLERDRGRRRVMHVVELAAEVAQQATSISCPFPPG